LAIWSIVKESWVDFRNNIFKFILFNGIWFIFASFLWFIGFRGFVVLDYYMLAIPLAFMGPLFLVGLHVIKYREFSIKKIINIFKETFIKGLVSFVLSIMMYGLLIFDFFFILNKIGDNKLFLIFPVIILYIMIMFSMIQLNYWGLLVMRSELKFVKRVKEAYRYTLSNFIFSFIWTIFILLLGAILIFSRLGIPVFFMSSIGLLIINGTIYMIEESKREETENEK
jgi:hypothetical protein